MTALTIFTIVATIVGIALVGFMGIIVAYEVTPLEKMPTWLDRAYDRVEEVLDAAKKHEQRKPHVRPHSRKKHKRRPTEYHIQRNMYKAQLTGSENTDKRYAGSDDRPLDNKEDYTESIAHIRK